MYATVVNVACEPIDKFDVFCDFRRLWQTMNTEAAMHARTPKIVNALMATSSDTAAPIDVVDVVVVDVTGPAAKFPFPYFALRRNDVVVVELAVEVVLVDVVTVKVAPVAEIVADVVVVLVEIVEDVVAVAVEIVDDVVAVVVEIVVEVVAVVDVVVHATFVSEATTEASSTHVMPPVHAEEMSIFTWQPCGTAPSKTW